MKAKSVKGMRTRDRRFQKETSYRSLFGPPALRKLGNKAKLKDEANDLPMLEETTVNMTRLLGAKAGIIDCPIVKTADIPERYSSEEYAPDKDELTKLLKPSVKNDDSSAHEVAFAESGINYTEKAKQLRRELQDLEPMERLERAAFLQRHKRKRDHAHTDWIYPLSTGEIARIKKEAIDWIRETAIGADSKSSSLLFLKETLLELRLIEDYESIAHDTELKVKHIHDFVKENRKTEQESVQKNHSNSLSTTESHTHSSDDIATGTEDRWRHLARAAAIFARHSNLSTIGDFKEKAQGMQADQGPEGTGPGEAILKGVRRLRKDHSGEAHAPERYHRLEGLRLLVSDLIRGADVSQNAGIGKKDSKTA